MKKTITIIILAFFGLACQEDNVSKSVFPLEEGTYQGIFIRSSPNTRWAPADVTMILEDGRFSGSSNTDKYPAICEGTYRITGSNQITFANECVWTADFDWTFILDGEFQIRERDQKLIITKEYEGSVVDTYELIIQ